MRPLLVDTHSFIWFVNGDAQLSLTARQAIEDESNERWLSQVSAWEMAIKINIGKLTLDRPLNRFITEHMARNDFRLLAIDLTHIWEVVSLPLHHRDPFDRLLVAQSMVEKMPLVSADLAFDAYPITRLW